MGIFAKDLPPLPRKLSPAEQLIVHHRMAHEALDAMPFKSAVDTIMGHLYSRKDVDHALLEKFSNQMGQLAHELARRT